MKIETPLDLLDILIERKRSYGENFKRLKGR